MKDTCCRLVKIFLILVIAIYVVASLKAEVKDYFIDSISSKELFLYSLIWRVKEIFLSSSKKDKKDYRCVPLAFSIGKVVICSSKTYSSENLEWTVHLPAALSSPQLVLSLKLSYEFYSEYHTLHELNPEVTLLRADMRYCAINY